MPADGYSYFVKTLSRRHLAILDFLWIGGVVAGLLALYLLDVPITAHGMFFAMAALFAVLFVGTLIRRSRNPFFRMNSLLGQGSYAAATEEAEAYLKDHPKDPSALAVLLQSAFGRGEMDDARACLAEIESLPDLPAAANETLKEWRRALDRPDYS